MPLGKYARSLAAVKNAKAEAEAKAIAEAKLILEEAERKASESRSKSSRLKNTTSSMQDIDFPDLMNWIYTIPYSRRLTFIPFDFSDGVLVAEIVKRFVPEIVDLHNYQSASGHTNKRFNWQLLNRKVFPQLGFKVGSHLIEEIITPKRYNVYDITAKPYPIERLLKQVQLRLAEINDTVYDYRTDPSKILDPFKKKERKRRIRPISRQPMSSVLWALERREASKYGEYTGNPITWDNVENEEAEVIMAGVGISKQRHAMWRQEYKAMKLKETEEGSNLSGFLRSTDPQSMLPENSVQVLVFRIEDDKAQDNLTVSTIETVASKDVELKGGNLKIDQDPTIETPKPVVLNKLPVLNLYTINQ